MYQACNIVEKSHNSRAILYKKKKNHLPEILSILKVMHQFGAF